MLKMRITILSGRVIKYEGTAHAAVMPGLDGEFSVLDFHQPFLYRLRKGTIKIRPEKQGSGETEKLFPIKEGLARFNENSLLVLCEIA